mgnify:CR=1 FL=1
MFHMVDKFCTQLPVHLRALLLRERTKITVPSKKSMPYLSETGLIRDPLWGHVHDLRFRHPTPCVLTYAEPFLEKLEHILITQQPSVVSPDAYPFFRWEPISLSANIDA